MAQPDAQVADFLSGDAVNECTRRGLFVVFHEIAPTIFESQIILHVKDMRAIGVEMEIWVFALTKNDFKLSRERAATMAARHGVSIRVFRGYRFGPMLADPVNAFRLWRALRTTSFMPDFIHARTDHSAFVCGLLRPLVRFDLIWDCRGDVVAELRSFDSNPDLRRRLLVNVRSLLTQLQRAAVRKLSTRAIFVSDALRSVCLGESRKLPSEVIPCVASTQLFHFSPHLRESVRRELKIAAASRVFIYSGSISFFQCFDESAFIFHKVLERYPDGVFLVVTPNSEDAAHALRAIPNQNVRLLSATIADVNGYLNAADFGILLRRADPINRVASPVKFAEYCLAGLPIIMTDAVEQSAQIGRELGNALQTELGSVPESLDPWSDADRASLSQKAAQRLGREAVVKAYRRTYRVSNEKER